MNIAIQPAVFRKFPQLKVGFLAANLTDNKSKLPEAQRLLRETERLINLTFHRDTIKTHLLISPWHVAKQEFGKKARHYDTSVERLIQLVKRGKHLPAKDVASTLVSYLTLKHIVPMGIDDTRKIMGNITFALAKGKERAASLKHLPKGELYYHDKQHILGTKLDYWKNPATMPSSTSSSLLIHIEALPPITGKRLKEIMKEMSGLLTVFGGATIKQVVLEKGQRRFTI